MFSKFRSPCGTADHFCRPRKHSCEKQERANTSRLLENLSSRNSDSSIRTWLRNVGVPKNRSSSRRSWELTKRTILWKLISRFIDWAGLKPRCERIEIYTVPHFKQVVETALAVPREYFGYQKVLVYSYKSRQDKKWALRRLGSNQAKIRFYRAHWIPIFAEHFLSLSQELDTYVPVSLLIFFPRAAFPTKIIDTIELFFDQVNDFHAANNRCSDRNADHSTTISV